LLRIRVDVDYPYPSRIRSFIFTALGIKICGDYLKNSKIIAKMINESTKEVKAYWFFTPKTVPDKELLELLSSDKHEVALHVVNDPFEELKLLEKNTGRKINYYTIHGTARLLARIMWKRWKVKAPAIPSTFPLNSFHQYLTFGLDGLCYIYNAEEAFKKANSYIGKGQILYFHPIWLFQRGKLNHRGPFYETLRRILEVDKEFESLALQRRVFFTLARDAREYEKDVIPTDKFLGKLLERGVDAFTFVERRWCSSIPDAHKTWAKEEDNIGLLTIISYEKWLRDIVKKTRHNMVRKAERSGIRTEIVEPDEKFAVEVWKIYNETPIRQNRAFPHYGVTLEAVKHGILLTENRTYVGAYLQDELVGFAQITHGNNIAILSQLLSLQKHCENKRIKWLMYGRMETAHPSLDSFKRHNGFSKFPLTRFYIPLTKKGKIAIKLGLHRNLKDALPKSIKYPLIPVYSWMSRTKMRIRLMLKKG